MVRTKLPLSFFVLKEFREFDESERKTKEKGDTVYENCARLFCVYGL